MNGEQRLGMGLLALLAALCSLFMTVPAQADEAQEVRRLLANGWTFLEARDMRKAEEAFAAAFDTQLGRNTAETYYAIAAVWWERRNAMAAYMWLSDGVKASRESFSWDGGQGREWDRRIGGRKRFIESNFTVVKFRAPARGKPLAPLADPPPLDPVLREFTERLPVIVAEGIDARVELQWVLLPNGSYWVGGRLQELAGGELDPSRAISWELVKDNRRNRRQYEAQIAAIEGGDSLALKMLKQGEVEAAQAGRRDAAQAAAKEEKNRQEILREARRKEAEKEFQRRAVEERKRREAALEEADRRERTTQSTAGSDKPKSDQGKAAVVADAGAADVDQQQASRAPNEQDQAEVKQDESSESHAGDPWARAVQKMEAMQEEERKEASDRRASVEAQSRRAGKTPPDLDAYLARRFYIAVGGGGVGVARLTDSGTDSELGWQGHWEFGYVAPLTQTARGPLGLAVALSYNNLPVSGCSQQQTRGHGLALHAAPRIGFHLKGRLWVQVQAGFHLGGLGTWATADERTQCAEARLNFPTSQVAYGARLGSDGSSARISFEELGWRGYALTLGPDLQAGISFAPRAAPVYVGAQFYLRHDQVFAVIEEGTYRYRVEGQDGVALGQQKLDSVSSTVSMARFQFGLRALVAF
ncbi:MAG: hypothetical protein CMP23_16715 [Rickettsiales bacterium]|nr:hypothetical protein [Rickettsiales bacterium]